MWSRDLMSWSWNSSEEWEETGLLGRSSLGTEGMLRRDSSLSMNVLPCLDWLTLRVKATLIPFMLQFSEFLTVKEHTSQILNPKSLL